ncbi:MAG: alpha-mannosidase [Lentisphaerae bacterium]|nr:alpha-mannosidase [Lentisphaerota bacterium]
MADQGMDRIRETFVRKIRLRAQEIEGHIWSDAVPLDVTMAETMDHLSLDAAKRLPYHPAADGQPWGRMWSTAWFHVQGRVPAGFRGEPVSLLFRPDGEGLIYRSGVPVQGLDVNRRDLMLFPRARGGERIDLYVETACNDRQGRFVKRQMQVPSLAVLNRDVWDAYHSLVALADMLEEHHWDFWKRMHRVVEHEDTRRAKIIFALNRAVDAYDYVDTSRAAVRVSAQRLNRALAPLYAQAAVPSAQTVAAIGHAHIDVAWLWPLAETVRKCGRTFSNVLALMDEYPEFTFVQSQPHLYEFTRERYPSLYRRMRAKARTGQWIPTGAMWVEADCNLTSGESLVRQILHGTRYFKKEFGYEVRCLWLPDVFGYSAALPQILRQSGIPYFLTQKISWSQFTTFPYHSFHWEGIDGSSVLSHFPPVSTYNSELRAAEIRFAERQYREKDRSAIQVIPFGYGDGGGGPTKGHIERMRRYRNLEGMPRLEPMSPEAFFDRLAKGGKDLPRWVGELYLELHRGTLTTQGHNKRYNRLCELRLREAEILGAMGLGLGGRYDRKGLHAAWRTVLLNQFHDIIPGSSIAQVYRDSDRDYRDTLAKVDAIQQAARTQYARAVDTRGPGDAVLVTNALSWPRTGVVAVAARKSDRAALKAVLPDGSEQPVQRGADGLLRFVAAAPAIGHAVCRLVPGHLETRATVRVTPGGLENDRVRVTLDRQGRVRRIFDKRAGREVLAPRAIGNQLIVFEDKPLDWDAWDVDHFYRDKPLEVDGKLESLTVVETGPVRGVLRSVRRLSKSRVTQDIVLTMGSARVDFVTRVEWGNESRVLLKVAFPVAVHAEKARYEIQFGSVERPTHTNMPEDFGRFEVAGQKWADLSETGYGVALLNDCKYGHDIRGNVMRLSLLRAPKDPDPTADINKVHDFTYAILPHGGDFTQGVVREGYALNVPLQAHAVASHPGPLGALASAVGIDAENVIIDTIKQAEDDESIIVRLYEAHGARVRTRLQTAWPVRQAWETDLLERTQRRLTVRGGMMRLDFGPFQIRTVKLTLAART